LNARRETGRGERGGLAGRVTAERCRLSRRVTAERCRLSRRVTAPLGRDERWGLSRRITAERCRLSRRVTAPPGRDERWGLSRRITAARRRVSRRVTAPPGRDAPRRRRPADPADRESGPLSGAVASGLGLGGAALCDALVALLGHRRPLRPESARPLGRRPGREHDLDKSTLRAAAASHAAVEPLLPLEPPLREPTLSPDRGGAGGRDARWRARATGGPGPRPRRRARDRPRADIRPQDGGARAAVGEGHGGGRGLRALD